MNRAGANHDTVNAMEAWPAEAFILNVVLTTLFIGQVADQQAWVREFIFVSIFVHLIYIAKHRSKRPTTARSCEKYMLNNTLMAWLMPYIIIVVYGFVAREAPILLACGFVLTYALYRVLQVKHVVQRSWELRQRLGDVNEAENIVKVGRNPHTIWIWRKALPPAGWRPGRTPAIVWHIAPLIAGLTVLVSDHWLTHKMLVVISVFVASDACIRAWIPHYEFYSGLKWREEQRGRTYIAEARSEYVE